MLSATRGFRFRAPFLASAYAQASLASALGLTKTFDYSKTGTDRLESIFDRLRLTDAQRTALYKGEKVLASDVRLHNEKTDVILHLERGELVYKTVNSHAERGLD